MKTSMGTDENLISVLQPYQIQGILNGAGAPNSRNVLFQRSYAIDKNEFALITQDEN